LELFITPRTPKFSVVNSDFSTFSSIWRCDSRDGCSSRIDGNKANQDIARIFSSTSTVFEKFKLKNVMMELAVPDFDRPILTSRTITEDNIVIPLTTSFHVSIDRNDFSDEFNMWAKISDVDSTEDFIHSVETGTSIFKDGDVYIPCLPKINSKPPFEQNKLQQNFNHKNCQEDLASKYPTPEIEKGSFPQECYHSILALPSL